MKEFLFILLAAGLVILPFRAYGDTPEDKTPPPVAQTLVREGDFALRLAEVLDIVKTEDEGEAEEALAQAGIAPKSGWISDFPVTPDILAEIKASVEAAADSGKIDMDPGEAANALYALSREMDLPIVAAAGAGKEGARGYITGERYAEGAERAEEYDYQPPTVINNYYYEQGPPVITYYPPPVDYAYLYYWDPFPFWWHSYFFPGFFVLRDFTTTVVVKNTGGTVNVTGGKVIVKGGGTVNVTGGSVFTRTKIVTNRIVDRRANKTVVINPVTRIASSPSAARQGAFNRDSARNILGGSALRGAAGRRSGEVNAAPALQGRGIRNGQGRISGEGRGRDFVPAPSLRGGARNSDSSPSLGGRGLAGRDRGVSRQRDFDPAPSLRGRGNPLRDGGAVQAPSFRDRGSVTRGQGRNLGGTRGFDPAPSLRGNSGRGNRGFAAPSFTQPRVSGGGGRGGMSLGGRSGQAPAFSAPNRGVGGQAFGGRSFNAPSGGRGFGAPGLGGGRGFGGGGGGRAFGGGGGGGCKGRC